MFLERYAAPGRLLDIGCSAGFFLDEARRAGWSVSGLEKSADTAALARALHDVDVTVGTLGQDDSLPSASFDVVTLWDVIEHVPEPLATLRRAHNLLSRDGVIAIQTPNIGGLFPRMSYLVARRLDYWPHPEPPGHLFQFSTRTLDRLLCMAGFRNDYQTCFYSIDVFIRGFEYLRHSRNACPMPLRSRHWQPSGRASAWGMHCWR